MQRRTRKGRKALVHATVSQKGTEENSGKKKKWSVESRRKDGFSPVLQVFCCTNDKSLWEYMRLRIVIIK